MPAPKTCKSVIREIEAFLKQLPETADPKVVKCITELVETLKERNAGGLHRVRDIHMINWLAWKRLLE